MRGSMNEHSFDTLQIAQYIVALFVLWVVVKKVWQISLSWRSPEMGKAHHRLDSKLFLLWRSLVCL
jgi:hypothetical protein